jgi:hypothetical protein
MHSAFPGRGERPAYCALTGANFGLCGSPGRSVNCAAGEKARLRIPTVTSRPAIPDAAKIMATRINW